MKLRIFLLVTLWFSVLTAVACSTGASTPTPTVRTATEANSPSGTEATSVPCFFTYYDPFAFLPNSSRLLVRAEGGVQIFDLHSMREVQFLTAPTGLNAHSVTFSADGRTFAWALEQGTIEWYRLSDFAKVATIRSRQRGALKVDLSPAGDQLYSISHLDGVDVWGKDGSLIHSFQPGGELMNIGISPEGETLATIPADGPVSMWSVEDLHLIKELGGSGGYDTSEVAFSPDGQYVAADLATGLFVWRLSDGAELVGAANKINSMAVVYSPGGHYLVYADGNKVIISSPDGSKTIRTLEGHQSPVFEVLFSPDSAKLVSADDREIRVWRVEDGALLAVGKSGCP